MIQCLRHDSEVPSSLTLRRIEKRTVDEHKNSVSRTNSGSLNTEFELRLDNSA